MSTKEAYKQRIDAELYLVQEKLARFKTQGMTFSADTRIKHAKHVAESASRAKSEFVATKTKLKELNEADEYVWKQLKDGVENMWSTLQSTLENTIFDPVKAESKAEATSTLQSPRVLGR